MSARKLSNQPYAIKGIDALFGEEQPSDSPVQTLPLNQITPSKQQPRQYFDPDKLNQLVESIKQHGILEPLLIRPQANGHYQLIAGERRYRAATQLGLTEVPVLIRDFSDQEALEVALIENLQREDLNPVEETEGILELIALRLERTPAEVMAMLNQAAHPERQSVDNVIHTPEWATLQTVFDMVGRFTPESFRTNRLPLLHLPKPLLDAIRQGQLEYTKARAIARIQDTAQQQDLLNQAIAQGWSLKQIKQQISQLPTPNTPDSRSPKQDFTERVATVTKLLKQGKVWADPKKRQKAEKLLTELAKLAES